MENMSLWSLAVPSGAKGVTAEVEQHASVLTYVHITNCALPPNPADGPHTLVISRSGVDVALATLEKGKQLQHSLDFILDATTVFKVVGPASSKSAIHLVSWGPLRLGGAHRVRLHQSISIARTFGLLDQMLAWLT
jgi:hypothetical protein